MQLGMISCNFYAEIYDYKCPADFDWGKMVKKHLEEFGLDELRALAKKIRSIGVSTLELWTPHASYLTQKTDYAAKARDVLSEEGLSVPVYCIGGWSKADIPTMDDAYAFAAELGAKVISGCISEIDTDETLDALDDFGAKYGIRYAIENHPRPSLCAPGQIMDLIKAHSEWVGANVDCGIYSNEGFDVPEAVRLFGERVYHVHFKDSGEKGHSCASGEGKANLAGVYEQLKAQNYAGMVSIEHEPQHDPTPELIRSVNWCNNVLGLR